MELNELQIGDLVFFESSILGILEHTAIFLGIRNGVPYILHATAEPYYAIMVNRLKNDGQFLYRVVRPTNTKIAVEALVILLGWAEYQVPYAVKAKTEKLMAEAEQQFSFELKSSALLQMNFGIEFYHENFHQYTEALSFLQRVSQALEVDGVGCAESIVMAFNLALLVLESSFNESKQEWCLLKAVNELQNPLPFDAKRALSAGIFEYCLQHSEHWLSLGGLELSHHIEVDPEEKEAWRLFKDALKTRSKSLHENSVSPITRRLSFATLNDSRKNSIDYADLMEFASSQFNVSTSASGLAESPWGLFFTPSKTADHPSHSISRFTPLPDACERSENNGEPPDLFFRNT